MLGVHNDEMPGGLVAQVTGSDIRIRGTFRVCALTKEKAGHMQMVCIESWQDLQVDPPRTRTAPTLQ